MIRLRVVLKADGTVGDIKFYSDAERPLLGAYAQGVRDLRFLPAIGNDGKPVDSMKEFVFTFSTSTTTLIF